MRNILYSAFILFTFFWTGFGAFCQEYTYKLNSKIGLASDEVYSVLQHKNGSIWFTTDNGISVFNGFSLKNFTIRDGMLDNVIFKQCEDRKGRVWFGSLNRKLFYFEGNEFRPATSVEGDTIRIPDKEILEMFAVKDSVFISTTYGTFKTFPYKGKFKLTQVKNTEDNIDLIFEKIHGHYCVTHCNKYPSPGLYKIVIKGGNSTIRYNTQFTDEYRSMFKTVYVYGNSTYFSIGKKLFRFSGSQLEESVELSNEIIFMEFGQHGGDVFTKYSGFHQIRVGDFKGKKRQFYNNQTITQRYIDREGGTWLSTIEHGVLYDASYTKDILFFDTDEPFPVTLIVKNGEKEIWFGNKIGDLGRFSGNQFYPETFETFLNQEINDLVVSKDLLVMSTSRNVSIYNVGKQKFELISRLSHTSFAISNIVNGCYYLADGKSLLFYERDKLLRKLTFPHRVYSLHQIGKVLYIGTKSGLFAFNGNKVFLINILGLPTAERIQIIRSKGNLLYLGTKTSGLIIYDLNTKKARIITSTVNGIIDHCVNAIEFLVDSRIAIGTPRGLSVIENSEGRQVIHNFNTTDGMVSEQVKSLCVYQGYLLWGTYDGIFGWPVDAIKKNVTPPKTFVERIELLGGGKFKKDLSHDENDIRIFFSTSAFRQYGDVRIRYKLRKEDTTFIELKNSNGILTLSSLEPGNYSIEIYTCNNHGVWTTNPATVEFKIDYPFWQRWPFILILSIVVGMAIYIFLNARFQRFKKREREKATILFEIEQLKMKALRLQINPHFLFNALNNIQGYYASGDILKAKDYIYHLSRFLRLLLETSKDEVISLEQEIEIVNFYCELNQFRYENNFFLELHKINIANPNELELPPMITQPFIENAFIHARPENEKLKVSLCLRLTNGILEIEIQDNGKSMTQQSLKRLKESGPTNGVGITIERIRAFNAKNGYSGEPLSFEITAEGCLIVRLNIKQNYAN